MTASAPPISPEDLTQAAVAEAEASAYYEMAVAAARLPNHAEAGRLLAKHDLALQRARRLRQLTD